jgi:hypothetical protein
MVLRLLLLEEGEAVRFSAPISLPEQALLISPIHLYNLK